MSLQASSLSYPLLSTLCPVSTTWFSPVAYSSMSETSNNAQPQAGSAVDDRQAQGSNSAGPSSADQPDATTPQQAAKSTDANDDVEYEYDGPAEENVVTIPDGGLAGLQARKEAERANRAQTGQPLGGRAGEYTLPYQNVRTVDR
ncbi:unnamed protein product [Tilletia controversa]|nr:unnamed protein product [Tilletia controversa]CAD6967814.1 unnamed protein product [Tilletia controversa]